MSLPRAARRRTPRTPRRHVAALLLAAFVLALLAPVALLADDDGEGCCRAGRCCCAGAPSDGACVRAACHCTGGSRAPVAASGMAEDALLPASVRSARPDAVPGRPQALDREPAAGSLRVPDQPPRVPLSDTAAS